MVRAKFTVESKCQHRGGAGGGTITLNPVISGSAENEKFYRYTPSGSITLSTVSMPAWVEFELGEEYYVDFTLAKK